MDQSIKHKREKEEAGGPSVDLSRTPDQRKYKQRFYVKVPAVNQESTMTPSVPEQT